MDFEKEVAELRDWFASPRFAGLKRVHSAREVVEQRGTIRRDYAVARSAAEGFHARLRELFEQKRCITTFGPYSPGQAVSSARTMGAASSGTSRATRSARCPTMRRPSSARCSP